MIMACNPLSRTPFSFAVFNLCLLDFLEVGILDVVLA